VGGPDLPLGPASLAGREVGGQKKAKAKAERWVAGTQAVRGERGNEDEKRVNLANFWKRENKFTYSEMAAVSVDGKKVMDVNIDHPAIKITNIFHHVNPHLHTATHGFEKFILASGNPIKKPIEGFFIVFASTTARAKFKKNSKWLMGLRKDHKAHKVNTLEVCSVMYNQNRDGFLEPIFKLLFFPPEAESHYMFGEEERLVLEYLKSGSRTDVEVATNVCCDVLGGPTNCTWIGNCCTTHISMLVLGNNVAQAFEKRSLLPQAITLRELCLAKVHNCRSRKSILPRILHLTQLECLHNILGNTTKVEKVSAEISAELERLEQRTRSSCVDSKELVLHNFAFGLHCIKKDLVERGLKHLSLAVAVGYRGDREINELIDREEAMVLQAAKTLISSMMEVAQGGASLREARASQGEGRASLGEGSTNLVEHSPPPNKPDDSPDPEQAPIQNLQESFEHLTINPMPFKLCSSLRKVSDSDVEVEILGAGPKQVNIFEVELFGVDDQQIRWQNTNFQEYFAKLEQSISQSRNFVSVALNSRDEITKLWVKEYNLDDEIVSEERSHATKSVTFSNTKDVFGDSGDLDDEISDNIDTIEILSRPAEIEDFVTVGDSVMDEFLDKLRDHLVEAKTAGKKNKHGVPWNVNVEREADEMVASLRGQADWFEGYLEELYNSWDAKKSRYQLAKDVDVDAIRSHLVENYRQPYSSKFNSNHLLRVTASLIADETKVLMDQKLCERLAKKETDEDIFRNFKTFYLERYQGEEQPEIEYEEVNKILEDNSVTLTFLEQGWNTQKNFKKFVYENLTFVKEQDYYKFTTIFIDFFMRFMKLAEGNSRKSPSQQEPEKELLQNQFKTFYQGKRQPELRYEEVNKILDKNSVTLAFLEQGWKTQNEFEKFVDDNLRFLSSRDNTKFTEIFKEFFMRFLKVPKGNSRKSTIQEGPEDIITVNDSEDEDTKEKVQAAPQVVYKKNPEFLYVGNLPKGATKEELAKVFAKYGKVKHVNMKGPTYCFVGFNNSDVVKKALKDCPIMIRGDHKLNVRENVEKVFIKPERADGIGLGAKKGEQERGESCTESKPTTDVKEQPEERPSTELKENATITNEGSATAENGRSKESLQKLLDNMTDERDRYISLYLHLKDGKAQSETEAMEQQTRNEKLQSDLDKALDQIRALEEKNKCLETDLQEMRTKMTTAKDDPKRPSTDDNTKTGHSVECVNIQTIYRNTLGRPQSFSVPLDSDGLLALASVQEQVHGGEVSCIFYQPFPAGMRRLLILEEGKFHPPPEGWGDTVYYAKISQQQNTRELSTPLQPLLPNMPPMLVRNTPPPLLPTPHIKLPNPNASLGQILYALPSIPPAAPLETSVQYFHRISNLLEPVVPLLSSTQKQLLEDYLKRNFNTTLPLFS